MRFLGCFLMILLILFILALCWDIIYVFGCLIAACFEAAFTTWGVTAVLLGLVVILLLVLIFKRRK